VGADALIVVGRPSSITEEIPVVEEECVWGMMEWRWSRDGAEMEWVHVG
jgi:hypothetical protein